MRRSAPAVLLGLSLIAGCGETAGGINIWDAVARGDGDAIRKYAAAGGDLNARNSDGDTPLWVALTAKSRDSYEALLKYGADPNVVLSGKRVVTHWAARRPTRGGYAGRWNTGPTRTWSTPVAVGPVKVRRCTSR